jgi:LuxR family maltose regulon positive regulatory protein
VQLVVVHAPAGFGKTSLLAQWRQELAAQGAAVCWLQSRPHHHPSRLAQSLVYAVRSAAARPGFGGKLLEATPQDGCEAATVWLGEVVHLAREVVLIVDEAERLPDGGREALAYLLHNAPANLRVVVATRPGADLGVAGLTDYGQCRQLGASSLRFTLEETLALARERLGPQFDVDAAARLHAMIEGWPLGVQLALSWSGPGTATALPATSGEDLRRRVVTLAVGQLPGADLDFLRRIAILDALHPDLCRAVVGAADAEQRLARLTRDTPVFVAGEHGEWLHMHAVVRDALRERFAALPAAEQAALHERAAHWLADAGLVDTAAEHALAAGQRGWAFELAERGLYESLMSQGRQQAVLDWLGLLPSDELDRRPRLLLAAAWSLATSDRHLEAATLVERLLEGAGDDRALHCECALILGAAAVFADDPDRFVALHDPWARQPPLHDAVLLQVHANRSALRALLDGEPALARLALQQARPPAAVPRLGQAQRWGRLIVGLSHLWEGQVRLAERVLAPALAQAEAELGRRSAFASMAASLLATAVWEGDRPAEAAALLADRLDVIERHGLPDTVLLGYRTMARIAVAEEAEHRAIELLGALHAAGRARSLPRLCLVSLVDQVRMHARRFRSETCQAICAQIEALLADPQTPQGAMWRRSVEPLRRAARVYVAVALQDWRAALRALDAAEAAVAQVRWERLRIELLGLRAYALERSGERWEPVLREAIDLARAYGLQRVFVDVHPGLGDLTCRLTKLGAEGEPAAASRPVAAEASRARIAPTTLLTPKEREVLGLLARSLSNKEIGVALQVGDETVKWHMKNLFTKLDANNRRQVVSRARMLGLLGFER